MSHPAPIVTASTPAPDRGRDLVLDALAAHGPSLLATARRYSLCADDAQDAYQRAAEIFLRHRHRVRPETASGWLRAVITHEALAVRAARLKLVGPADHDLDSHESSDLGPADERAAALEHLNSVREALRQLKPDELRALVLKAHGYSYEEIAQLNEWTYTKVYRPV